MTKLPKVRENAGDQATIGFTFASDWLREWVSFLDQSQSESGKQRIPGLLSSLN